MCRNLICLVVFALVFDISFSERCNAQEEKAELLAGMTSYDKIAASSLLVEGSVSQHKDFGGKVSPSIENTFPKVVSKFSYASSGSNLAYTVEYLRLDGSVMDFIKSAGDDNGVTWKNDNGDMLFRIRTREALSIDESRSAYTVSDSVLRVDLKENHVILGDSKNLVFSPADSARLLLPSRVMLWSIGRGFSDLISEIDRIEKMPDETLSVFAKGSFDGTILGTWELVLDRSSQFIVRQAKFFRASESETAFVNMSNDGLVSENELVFPSVARCLVSGRTKDFQIERVALGSSVEVLERAKDYCAQSPETDTIVIDYRVSPAAVSTIVAKGPAEHSEPLVLSSRRKQLSTIVFINLSLVLLCLLVFFFFRRRKRGGV